MHTSLEKRKKLDDTGVKCYFLGYEKNHKTYRLLNADDGSIVISRNVPFSEQPTTQTPKSQVQKIFDIDDKDDISTPSSDEVEVKTTPDENMLRTPPMRAHQVPEHDAQ